MATILKILFFTLVLSSCGLKPEFQNPTAVPETVLPSKIQGCTFSKASNFNAAAEVENGECQFSGCTVFDEELKIQFHNYLTLFPTQRIVDTCPALKNDVFNQENQPEIGILWVIDNSYSMEEEQKNLANSFNSFINSFTNTRLKFTMGITTTDSRHIADSLLLLNSTQMQANRGKFINDFKTRIKVGTNGSSNEKGYLSAYNFLNDYSSHLLKNSNTYLSVIFVSDEPDGSPKGADFYLNHLYTFVSSTGKLQTHAILDLDNSGEDDSTHGEKYLYSVNKTGGIKADIDDKFDKTLAKIGSSIATLVDSFTLSKVPYLPSLEVFINGIKVLNWTYDASKNSIHFTTPPTYSAEVSIKYTPVK